MSYRIQITPSARKQLAKLPRQDQRRIVTCIDGLANDPTPQGSRSLEGSAKGLYRIRVGDYRVIYQIARSVLLVTVIRVGQRGDVYRNL